MDQLKGSQRRRLRSLAHGLRPLAQVGKQGMTDTVVQAVDEALEAHELIKVKFVERKGEKRAISEAIALRTASHLVGIVGHVATFYRRQEDDAKRAIELPDG